MARGEEARNEVDCLALACALDGLDMQRVAHRFQCGVTIRAPAGCMTRTEACALLKVGPHRFRGLIIKVRHVHHRMYDGPHCHRIAYVPLPLAEFLRLRLPWDDGGPVPVGAIAEAEHADTIEAKLFVSWAIERNARCCARLLCEVGRRSEAWALRPSAAACREFREGLVRAIIESVEEQMPEHGR